MDYKKTLSKGIEVLLSVLNLNHFYGISDKEGRFLKKEYEKILRGYGDLSFYENVIAQTYSFQLYKEIMYNEFKFRVDLIRRTYRVCKVISTDEVVAEIFNPEVSVDYFVNYYSKTIKELLPQLDEVDGGYCLIKEKIELLSADQKKKSLYMTFLDEYEKLSSLIKEKIDQLLTELSDLNRGLKMENKIFPKAPFVDGNLVFRKNTKLNYSKAEKLLLLLQQEGFISEETSIHDFCVIFQIIDYGLNGEEYNANPIVWIKKSGRVNNNKINRLALIDLLLLLGYNTHDIIGEEGNKYKRLNNCFKAGDRPFKANDFTNYFSSNSHELNVNSEYHDILLGLLKQAGIDVNFH